MSRANINFETYFEKLARIMSRQHNITVKIEGNVPYTDGEVIVLPMLEEVSDELKSDMEGFLDHEVAHVKYTDFKELKKPKRLYNRFHKELFNAVEDSRIEILLPQEYSGTAFNLDRLNQKWTARMNKDRDQMPWPIRLILCIREIYDGKKPKTDEQIEPILAAIYDDAVELRKCRDSKEVLDATEKLLHAINLAREALSKGLPPVPEEELEEAIEKMRGGTPPVELDPNRKEKEGKEAQGMENLDPATERKDSKDKKGEGDEDGESEEGEEGNEGESKDGDDQDGENQEGESSDQSCNNAGMSAEQDGKQKGKGDKSEGEEGDSGDQDGESDSSQTGEGEDESEGEGDEDGESSGDGDEDAESDGQGDQDGDADSEGDQDGDAKSKQGEKAPHDRNSNIETHESVTGDEGDASKDKKSQQMAEQQRPQFDGKQELETRKNYADWKDNATEQQMLKDAVESKTSEFNNHVFSPESYMEIQLEKAIESEPTARTNRGYYYGKEKDINAKHVSLPFSREYDEVIEYTGKGNKDEYSSRKRKVMKHVNPIKNHLERVLKVKENAKITPEQERGQLNTRTLAQMSINKNYRTPFKKFTKEDTTNVAVTLLIDCSGSMHGEPIEVARQTALALGEGLKAIGITFEALGFNTDSNHELASRVRGLKDTEVARFNRFGETLRLMVFKKFDSNDLSGICKAEAGGCNADGESVVWAAKRLAQRKEKRKILIVLSDGQPSYGGANHEVLAGDLKRVISILPKAGIEPIGIGIQTDDPKLFYPDWIKVEKLDQLSTTVMGKLCRMLEKGMK